MTNYNQHFVNFVTLELAGSFCPIFLLNISMSGWAWMKKMWFSLVHGFWCPSFAHHKLSWTFSPQMNSFSSWGSQEIFGLLSFRLPSKFGKEWIYRVHVTAPQRKFPYPPLFPIFPMDRGESKKARAIEALQNRIKAPEKLFSRNWMWWGGIFGSPAEAVCHYGCANLRLSSSQKSLW